MKFLKVLFAFWLFAAAFFTSVAQAQAPPGVALAKQAAEDSAVWLNLAWNEAIDESLEADGMMEDANNVRPLCADQYFLNYGDGAYQQGIGQMIQGDNKLGEVQTLFDLGSLNYVTAGQHEAVGQWTQAVQSYNAAASSWQSAQHQAALAKDRYYQAWTLFLTSLAAYEAGAGQGP